MMILKFRCPDCADTFKWPGDQPWPRFCPLCQAPQTTRDDEICLPAIRTHKMKIPDQVYRDMEGASIVRQEMAAETLGISKNDVSDLKMTNLRDNHHPEMAHVPVVNEVSKLMDKAPDATGFQSGGEMFSPHVQSGPNPNAGAKTQTLIRKMHAERFGHGLVGDNPANEVMNPNYRRRA